MASRTLGQKILIGLGILFLIACVAVGILVGLITGAFNIQTALPSDNEQQAVDHPVSVLFVAYPEELSQRGDMFQGENACTFRDCVNYATIVDTDFKTYRYHFNEKFSGGYVLVSPNREYVFLPMDAQPKRFYRGALSTFETDNHVVRYGYGYLHNDGTLVRHTAATNRVGPHVPALTFITDSQVETKPFNYAGVFQACDDRLFYFGSKIEGEETETATWHEFEVNADTRSITPLNRFNELRPNESFIHRQCLGDGRGSMAMVTAFERTITLSEWEAEQGIYHEEIYEGLNLFNPELVHVTKEYVVLANTDGEYQRFDRGNLGVSKLGSVHDWDRRLDPYRSIIRFMGNRVFVLGKYDRNPDDDTTTYDWMGLEVDLGSGEVRQRVTLPGFDETYPERFTLNDLVITDGDAFSAWLTTQPPLSE